MPDTRFMSDLFPRSSRYHPDRVMSCASGGANSLWLAEWLAEALDLQPGMRVLDLGCGQAGQSIFLAREFGAQVWATDLWYSVSENEQRIRDAGVADRVFAFHEDARSLPFAPGSFDAIVCIDSFMYFATDDHYLNYLVRFVKPGGQLGLAGASILQEIDGAVPDHLAAWWDPSVWSLHSPAWWRRHWEKTGFVTIERAEAMPDGWRRWLDWQYVVCPQNTIELKAVEADAGRYFGYLRLVARRRHGVDVPEPIVSVPGEYVKAPLLRGE